MYAMKEKDAINKQARQKSNPIPIVFVKTGNNRKTVIPHEKEYNLDPYSRTKILTIEDEWNKK
jgi:hypothetical protein